MSKQQNATTPRLWAAGLSVMLLVLLLVPGQEAVIRAGQTCAPTPSDAMGPYYKPDAPVRSKVGEGYVLKGTVKSADGCKPLTQARIELWLTAPDGEYDDAHRATVQAGDEGEYRFESNFPGDYGFRPPHIHMRITAPGHETLVTQHYPQKGDEQGMFDVVLKPRPRQ